MILAWQVANGGIFELGQRYSGSNVLALATSAHSQDYIPFPT